MIHYILVVKSMNVLQINHGYAHNTRFMTKGFQLLQILLIHLLKGFPQPIIVFDYHENLTYFQNARVEASVLDAIYICYISLLCIFQGYKEKQKIYLSTPIWHNIESTNLLQSWFSKSINGLRLRTTFILVMYVGYLRCRNIVYMGCYSQHYSLFMFQ